MASLSPVIASDSEAMQTQREPQLAAVAETLIIIAASATLLRRRA
jgi:hypothetical protein